MLEKEARMRIISNVIFNVDESNEQLDETKEEQKKKVRKIEVRRSKQGESVVITVDRKNKILIKRFSQIVSSKIYVALRWPCVVRE